MIANSIYRSNQVETLVSHLHQSFHTKSNDTRIEEQHLQYAFYSNESYTIEQTLLKDLMSYYDADSKILRILHSWLNITKKIINALAVIYKEPAQRKIMVNGQYSKELSEYYNSLLPPNVNTIDRRSNRLAALQGGSISLFHWDETKKRFVQKVNSGHFYNVIHNLADVHKIDALSYFREADLFGEQEVIEIVWTDSEYYIVKHDGTTMPFGENPTTANIYGIIPACTFSDKQNETFWGNGANDIIKANREINALLVKLTYDDLILGTAGHLFGVDLDNITSVTTKRESVTSSGLSSREPYKENGEGTVATLKGGRQNVIVAKSGRQGTSRPQLQYVSTNPQVEAVFKTIENKLKMVAITRGLNPDAFSDMVRSTSGFAKVLDKLELMEIRSEDLDSAREYERDRFDTLRQMNNVHYELGDTSLLIPDDAEIRIDFGEIKAPKTTAEEWMEFENEIKYDISNVRDLLKRKNPDIKTDDEAQKILDDNRALNEKYKDLKPVVSQNGLDNPENNANINNR